MRKRLLVIIISFVAIVGLAVGALVAVQRNAKLRQAVEKLGNLNTNQVIVTNTVTTKPNSDIPQVEFVAQTFAERYGTLSNQDPSALRIALSFCSPTLAAQITTNIDDQLSRPLPATPITITTKAFGVVVDDIDTTTAQATVLTQRTQVIGTSTPTEKQQYLAVRLSKIAGSWKVTSAQWREG